nr:helix-turn-helix transcriptional regulator [Paenibacillus mucilaginosus]
MRSFHFPAVKLLLAYPLQEGCAAVIFGEKLKTERGKKGWTQEELAEKLFVSRQSVSKWENGQNYPSIEIIIKISDLFGLTIDELLRSDEELTKQVIKESKQLAYPKSKFIFDVLFLAGVVLLVIKIGVLLLNRFTSLDVTLLGGRFFWNVGPLILMVFAGIGSGILKEKYKQD